MAKNKTIRKLAVVALTGLSFCVTSTTQATSIVEETPKVMERFSDYNTYFLNLEYSDQQAIINSLRTYLEKYTNADKFTPDTVQGTLTILLNEFEKSVKDLDEANADDVSLAKDRLSTLDAVMAEEVEDRISDIATSDLIKSLKYTSTGSASIIGDMEYTSMGDDLIESFRLDMTDYSLMQNIFEMALKADMSFKMDSQTLGGNITAKGTLENIQKNGKQFIKFSDVELSSDISEINEEFQEVENSLPLDKYLLIDNQDASEIAALQGLSSSELSDQLKTFLKTEDLEVISTEGDRVYLRITQKSCNRIKKSALAISELLGDKQNSTKTCSKSDLNEIITDLGQIYLDIEEDQTSLHINSKEGLKITIVYNDNEIISHGIIFEEDLTELSYKQADDNFALEINAPDMVFALVQKDKTIAGKLKIDSSSEKITGNISGKGDLLSLDVEDFDINIDVTDASGIKTGSFSFIKDLHNYSMDLVAGSFYSFTGKYTSDKNENVDFEAQAKMLGSEIFTLKGNGNVNDELVDIEYNGTINIPYSAQADFSGSAKTEKKGDNTKQDYIYKIDLKTNMQEFEKMNLKLQILSDETRIKGKTTEVIEPSNFESINY